MKKNVLPFPPSRDHSLDSQLRFAIANKRLLRFTYDSALRVAEPHDYGLRDGTDKVLVYQRQKGARKDSLVRGWRSLETAKMQECMVLEESFSGTRETADQRHSHWDMLYARVDDPK